MNDAALISVIVGAGSGAITVLVNWLISRGKNRVAAAKTDRELLSADEKAFRATIIAELDRVRKLHNDCEKQNADQQVEINGLRARIFELEKQRAIDAAKLDELATKSGKDPQ